MTDRLCAAEACKDSGDVVKFHDSANRLLKTLQAISGQDHQSNAFEHSEYTFQSRTWRWPES